MSQSVLVSLTCGRHAQRGAKPSKKAAEGEWTIVGSKGQRKRARESPPPSPSTVHAIMRRTKRNRFAELAVEGAESEGQPKGGVAEHKMQTHRDVSSGAVRSPGTISRNRTTTATEKSTLRREAGIAEYERDFPDALHAPKPKKKRGSQGGVRALQTRFRGSSATKTPVTPDVIPERVDVQEQEKRLQDQIVEARAHLQTLLERSVERPPTPARSVETPTSILKKRGPTTPTTTKRVLFSKVVSGQESPGASSAEESSTEEPVEKVKRDYEYESATMNLPR